MVHRDVLAAAVDDAILPARLSYDPSDPIAVSITFGTGGDTVSWTMARELLWDGLATPGKWAGVGDVAVTRTDGTYFMRLTGPDGRVATFRFQASEIRGFLSESYVVVPRGYEASLIDWDSETASIMRSES